MAKYTYKDVIIDPEDPRVEIGAEYYFALGAQACIEYANSGRRKNTLDGVDKSGEYNPFITDEKDYPFIIRKKESKKKYAPFDLLNDYEAREKLAGVCVKDKENEDVFVVTYMSPIKGTVKLINSSEFSMDEILKWFTFLDGTPCGKLVEVEDASK